tara:strand:+ start:914 stop:1900 length:987 start_codon:yes stop_codon:yes gene_type:complete
MKINLGMKIALIGPGIMEIPPDKWGAVEMLIWDYYKIIKDLGHRVQIINTPDKEVIKFEIEHGNFDIVHLHYDVFSDIITDLVPLCKRLIVSSHYPYINTPHMWGRDGYGPHFAEIRSNDDYHIFASSEKDIATWKEYGAHNHDNIWLSKLGVRCDPYQFNQYPQFDSTLCFSQVCDRKRQWLLEEVMTPDLKIDIIGRREQGKYRGESYLGEMPRNILNQSITNYSNFVLLSEVENTTPLVVKEALICGLGVVVSEEVSPELDTSKSFIDVIPEDKMTDLSYIRKVIYNNKKHSRQIRREIRKYGIDTFGLENILAYEYLPKLQSLI